MADEQHVTAVILKTWQLERTKHRKAVAALHSRVASTCREIAIHLERELAAACPKGALLVTTPLVESMTDGLLTHGWAVRFDGDVLLGFTCRPEPTGALVQCEISGSNALTVQRHGDTWIAMTAQQGMPADLSAALCRAIDTAVAERLKAAYGILVR